MSIKFDFKKYLLEEGFKKEISAYSPKSQSEFFRINNKLAIVGIYFIYTGSESFEVPKTKEDAEELISLKFPKIVNP